MSAKPLTLFEDAMRTVQGQAGFLGSERVSLEEAVDRILAEDIRSDIDMPPFDKSAMDGYACRREDLAEVLSVIEIIPAGQAPTRQVGRGECAQIMTGAGVPEGADCVVPVEVTESAGEGTVRFTGGDLRDNICRRAEDIREGDILLRNGERITPQAVAVLATVGATTPLVARRPLVAVMATGNELVEPDMKPGTAQIRNSNGHQLREQVIKAGAMPRYLGIARDTEEDLNRMIGDAVSANDVILLSGGVSMGKFDLVPGVLEKNGFDLLFSKIAVKPGKPTVFGVGSNTFCFGLPGNPVSTFVIFEIIVKPFLLKLMGHDYRPFVVPLRLAETVRRRKSNRDQWMPVERVGLDAVRAIEYHGSAHLNAMTEAEGLICMPRGSTEIEKGSIVNVRPI